MAPRIKADWEADSEQKKKAFQTALVDWFTRHGRELPWRQRRDPYAVLVSEMMLQQTQVATVISYFQRWMKRFPDLHTLAKSPEEAVLEMWQGLGYYSRARHLHRAARAVVELHNGTFPQALEPLRALPGVGPYTAAAICAFAFDLPTPPIDGNLQRVLARLFDYREPVDTSTGMKALHELAHAWQPKRHPGRYHEAMMELGALICTPRSPGCRLCPVQPWCGTRNPEQLPVKKPRRTTVSLEESCGWVVGGNGSILLEQQTGRRWHGLWRLPLLRVSPGGEPLRTTRYPFTHHQITLKIYPATEADLCGGVLKWFTPSMCETVAMTAPHRRMMESLMDAD